jgi:hypothetical protein
MPSRFYQRGLCLSFLAVAIVLGACSQAVNTVNPSAGSATSGTAITPSGKGIAPQAKAMLALLGHAKSNRSVIAKTAPVSDSFAPAKSAKNSIYDSIVVNKQGKTSSYISSLGFECCSTKEFGDGLVFTQSNARLKEVSVVMSSWGCESGFWNNDTCTTSPGTGFEEPITANVYAVVAGPSGSPEPGQLLASQTKDFLIPYRPSANNQICTGQNLGAFLGKYDKECDNGLSVKINWEFKLPKVILPQEAIVTVAYNTSDAGYNPYGDNTQCFTGPGGCGYDALNVSADGTGGFVGSNVDPNGVFDNFGNAYFYCNGTGNGSGGLQLDTPCWTDYHPEIDVTAEKS